MKKLISGLVLIFSVFHAGSFEVQTSWADDLQVTFENEVAGVTPGMQILSPEKGTLSGDGINDMAATPWSYSYPKDKAQNSYRRRESKVTLERKYANAGYIVSDQDPVGSIIKLFEQKLGSSGPDKIFVDIGRRQGVEKGDQFTVYSLDSFIYHPVLPGSGLEKLDVYMRRTGFTTPFPFPHPGKPVGHRLVVHGVVEISELGDKVSYARVVKAYGSLEPGHLLMPYKKYTDKSSGFFDVSKSIEGYMVATRGDRISIMADDIIYIDKGWDDDVRPGDHFEVYTIPSVVEDKWYRMKSDRFPLLPGLEKILGPEKTPLLPLVLGELEVIDTQKKTATAIVVKSNIDMAIGNQIRLKPSGQSD